MAAGLLLFTACQSDVVVSPPARQKILYGSQPPGPFVRVNQPDATRYFVSGIYTLQGNAWRWAAGQAVLRFHLAETANLNYVMKFTVPREVIAARGPVRLKLLINGKKWLEQAYERDGIYEIQQAVPPQLLKPDADNIVTIQIDKPWRPEGDAPERGFILVHAGFQPA